MRCSLALITLHFDADGTGVPAVTTLDTDTGIYHLHVCVVLHEADKIHIIQSQSSRITLSFLIYVLRNSWLKWPTQHVCYEHHARKSDGKRKEKEKYPHHKP
ncbi:hypothetical protein BDV25DRAFT_72998 [Aspergillus avenaceus]|uniref:Uncharacterized protein n=1 Tax=Aspergillus avenaceus TaxID=36643 RepID=A0A5N6TG78_ASPAV|nr:hypothetical protein BDV25DRAFT_72998 [Aspergillus avenaceus]